MSLSLTLAAQAFVFSVSASTAGPSPAIEYRVSLPPRMAAALARYNPDFKPWDQRDFLPALLQGYSFSPRQSPSAVIGDFNGDGAPDVALLGHDKKQDLLISILSEGKDYKVVEIGRFPLTDPKTEWYDLGEEGRGIGIWESLSLVGPGTAHSSSDNAPLELKTDAIVLDFFEKASTIYYFKDGHFEEFISSD